MRPAGAHCIGRLTRRAGQRGVFCSRPNSHDGGGGSAGTDEGGERILTPRPLAREVTACGPFVYGHVWVVLDNDRPNLNDALADCRKLPNLVLPGPADTAIPLRMTGTDAYSGAPPVAPTADIRLIRSSISLKAHHRLHPRRTFGRIKRHQLASFVLS